MIRHVSYPVKRLRQRVTACGAAIRLPSDHHLDGGGAVLGREPEGLAHLGKGVAVAHERAHVEPARGKQGDRLGKVLQ